MDDVLPHRLEVLLTGGRLSGNECCSPTAYYIHYSPSVLPQGSL